VQCRLDSWEEYSVRRRSQSWQPISNTSLALLASLGMFAHALVQSGYTPETCSELNAKLVSCMFSHTMDVICT